MSMTTIGLGLLAWVLLTMLLAPFIGQMINLREHRRMRAAAARRTALRALDEPEVRNRMAPP